MSTVSKEKSRTLTTFIPGVDAWLREKNTFGISEPGRVRRTLTQIVAPIIYKAPFTDEAVGETILSRMAITGITGLVNLNSMLFHGDFSGFAAQTAIAFGGLTLIEQALAFGFRNDSPDTLY